jgi:hypothetical protein
MLEVVAQTNGAREYEGNCDKAQHQLTTKCIIDHSLYEKFYKASRITATLQGQFEVICKEIVRLQKENANLLEINEKQSVLLRGFLYQVNKRNKDDK